MPDRRPMFRSYPYVDVQAFKATPRFLGGLASWLASVLGLGLVAVVALGPPLQDHGLGVFVWICLFLIAILANQVVILRRTIGQLEDHVFPADAADRARHLSRNSNPFRLRGDYIAELDRRITALENRDHLLGRHARERVTTFQEAEQIDDWLDTVGNGLRGELHVIKKRLTALERAVAEVRPSDPA